ncbi:unnamed protein product [Acanthoscelides obtectus]|uniref:Odorant receptor n=1 Tax=Acanthoscelides obtectus TaxID=200917 RepID=A0A9P0MA13_ACAOB|nr:unnamed protein product [Acanthoscelides obtectus]CAK1669410.1 hypothetical protein AOBTE_LOCUS26993 [Acanthoscelides obtectus]
MLSSIVKVQDYRENIYILCSIMAHYNIRQCLKFLTIVGCNPGIQNSRLQLVLYVFSTSGSAIIILLAILLFFCSEDALTIEDIANIFSTIIAFVYVISKLTMMYTKKREVQDMLIKVDKSFWKIDDTVNPMERQTYLKITKETRQMFHLLVFLFMFWLFSTFGIYSTPMESYRPPWIPLTPLIAFENVFCVLLVITIITIDVLIMTIVILTTIQFKMVSAEVTKLFTDTSEMRYTQNTFNQKLKKLIDHHNFLLHFASLINQTFTVSMVVYVGNIVSLLCIYMYHLSIMTTPNIYTIRDFFVLLLTLYGFVICYCWPAQNFADENEKIRDSVYSSNWYEYLRFSKPILMIMKRLELKVSISAGGIANINLETCLKVRSNNFMLIYFTDVGT